MRLVDDTGTAADRPRMGGQQCAAMESFGPLHVATPDLTTLRPAALAITVIAALLIFKLRWSVLRTLGICAALGLGAALVGLPGI